MRQGLLLDLLFRTPAIPPSLTLPAIILDCVLRILKQQPILGNADADQEGKKVKRSTRVSTSSGATERRKDLRGGPARGLPLSGSRQRLFGGRPEFVRASTGDGKDSRKGV